MSSHSVISADSHVVEPADLWLDLLPARLRDRAPHVERGDNGLDNFWCEGQALMAPARMSRAGKPEAEWGATIEDVYPGAYDPTSRLGDMETDGVDAEVVYPTIAMRLYQLQDSELRRSCLEAYNTWIGDFCSAYPDRLKGIATLDTDDGDAAIAELGRVKKSGLAGAMIAVAGDDPRLYSGGEYDRFWGAAEDLEVPISLHLVSGKTPLRLTDSPTDDIFRPAEAQRSLANLVFGGVFQRFPRLRVVSSENDVGWAPYFLEIMDRTFREDIRRVAQEYPIKDGDTLPSEYFRRNVAMTFIWDRSGVEARYWPGVENLMWSNDYPHGNSTWPNSRKAFEYLFKGVPDDEKAMMVASNAARIYKFG